MIVETTLNVHEDILEEVQRAAELLDRSRTEIIVSLLKIVMRHEPGGQTGCRGVRYQEKSDRGSWRRVHVRLRWDDYEYFCDLRKFLKMSVSCLLAYAVKKYMKKLFDGDESDNYQFKNYILSRRTKDGYIYWHILWGYPPDVEKYIPPLT